MKGVEKTARKTNMTMEKQSFGDVSPTKDYLDGFSI